MNLQVAQTNRALNISDVGRWRSDNSMVLSDEASDDAADIRTMLCMPIVNANKDVIGVAQLINKVRGASVVELLTVEFRSRGRGFISHVELVEKKHLSS